MSKARDIECWLTDMDGVLVHEEQALPGAAELIQRWVDTSKRFLVLTNNSLFTPRDLSARLKRSGLRIPQDNIWTSAMATGAFLKTQPGDKTAYVIGEAGLTFALHDAGFVLTDDHPDFVVLHPRRGALILEVKDWRLDTIRRATREYFEIAPDGTPKVVMSPL